MGEYEFWLGSETLNMGLGKRKLYGLPQSIHQGYHPSAVTTCET